MNFLRDIDVKNKKVLMRADFNIFMDNEGVIKDDFRIRVTLPTIKYLLEQKTKIILMTHLGKPNGQVVESLKLDCVKKKLEEHLKMPVKKASDCIGEEVEKMADDLKIGEILLLENLRFHKEEEKNDGKFAEKLARLGDVYVNDAFGVCHRAHASVSAITKYLQSAAGFLLEKEIKNLTKILETPDRPFAVIIGGVKISTKIILIKKFLPRADHVMLGGALANTVLHAKGIAIGKSVFEEEMVEEVKKLELTDTRLHIPVDAIASVDKTGHSLITSAAVGKTGPDELILDIGPETESLFNDIIKNAKTVIWNGPMGFFETDAFSHGTKAIAQIIAEQDDLFSVVGGGETIALIDKMGLFDKFSHVSSGGGAMLAFLAGDVLPGIEALR